MERRIKILLADDSPNIHKAVALGLRKLPYELVYCDNGQDALRLIKEQLPDILLADLEMPGPSGAELCQIIKADPVLKKVRVVLLCGSFDNIDDQHLESLPADARIWKPFETQVLISVLQTVLKAPPPRQAEKTWAGPAPVASTEEKTRSQVFNEVKFAEPTVAPAERTRISKREDLTSEMTRETFYVEEKQNQDFWGTKTQVSPLPEYSLDEANPSDATGSFGVFRESKVTPPDSPFDLDFTAPMGKIIKPAPLTETQPKMRIDAQATQPMQRPATPLNLPTPVAFDVESLRPMISEIVAQEVNLALRGHFKAEFQKILSDVLREIDSKTKLS